MRYFSLPIFTFAGIALLLFACTNTPAQTIQQTAPTQKTYYHPNCVITSPKRNAHFAKPTTIHVTADIRDKYNEPVTVEFILCKGAPPTEKTLQTITVTSPPYAADFNKVPTGKYCIFAKASKQTKLVSTWSRVDVTVGSTSQKAIAAQKSESRKPE